VSDLLLFENAEAAGVPVGHVHEFFEKDRQKIHGLGQSAASALSVHDRFESGQLFNAVNRPSSTSWKA
jgi:hypothetical protein